MNNKKISFEEWLKTEDAKQVSSDPKVKIAAVMSLPRITFTENMLCAVSVFPSLGISLDRATGAFWHNGLTKMLEKYIETHDYIITVDYDTYFTREQVIELLKLAGRNPDVAAIVPIQTHREKDTMLMSFPSPEGVDRDEYILEQFEKDLATITTGHFGLTVLNCEYLRQLEKPWFQPIPGPDGGWNEGRIDADIYFWKKMEAAGMKVCLAPQIKIGHLQQMVTYPGSEENGFKPEHHYITDIYEKGLPEHCRLK